MRSENSTVINWIIGFLFVVGLIWVVFPSAREAMGIYFFISVIALVVYRSPEYQQKLYGLGKDRALKSSIYAILVGVGFYVLTVAIPGFSLGLPNLPQSISSQMRGFIVIVIAPWIETFFVQGAFFGWIRTNVKNIYVAITIQALFFAILHLTAYISGFYDYPNFVSGLTALSANLGAFLSAFVFAWLAGFFVSLNGIRNLLFVVLLHTILNVIIYTKFTFGI